MSWGSIGEELPLGDSTWLNGSWFLSFWGVGVAFGKRGIVGGGRIGGFAATAEASSARGSGRDVVYAVQLGNVEAVQGLAGDVSR